VREIQIRGHAVGSAQQFLISRPEEFHSLVISDSDCRFPDGIQGLSRDILHLAFDDLCFPTSGYRLPNLAAIQKGIAWAAGREKLLIACHAGISRSAAFAYVIGCTDRSPEEALKLIDPLQHRPNDLVVSLGAKALRNSGS